MANAKIMARDLAPSAATIATFTGTEVATLPIANLVTYGRTPTARWSTPAGIEIRFTYASDQEINTVMLGFHNLSLTATWQITMYSDAAFTTLVDATGVISAFAPTGLTPVLNSVNIPEFKQFKNSTYYTSVNRTNIRGVRILVYDPSNIDGYIDIGRCMFGRSEQFIYGDPFGGVNLQIKDLSTSARAGNGSVITDKGQAFRELQINKQYISEVPDASGYSDWNKILEAFIRCGSDKEFFYSQFPSATNSGTGTTEEMYYQGVFKFASMSAIDRFFYQTSRTQFTLAGQ